MEVDWNSDAMRAWQAAEIKLSDAWNHLGQARMKGAPATEIEELREDVVAATENRNYLRDLATADAPA